jgi:hypothetical protein
MDKFRHKLPREDLKKFAREVNKKLVDSDYSHNRVEDPTSITDKQAKKVKKYVKDYLDRAVVKLHEHEKRKGERASKNPSSTEPGTVEAAAKDEDTPMSDVGEDDETPSSSSELKRKREVDGETPAGSPSGVPLVKRLKEEDMEIPSPPPPPPPPPEETYETATPLTDEERSMREQEEALMRENEEAQRLEDEAAENSRTLKTMPAAESNGTNKDANNGTGEPQVNGTVVNSADPLAS